MLHRLPLPRLARRAELPAVADLVGAALETFRGLVPDTPLDLYIAYSRDMEERWRSGDVMVIDGFDGRIAATATYIDHIREPGEGLPPGWASFRTLAVHPKARGQGLGRRMVEYCVDAARNDGASVIGLHTGEFMADARRIYKAAGFSRCPEHDFFAAGFFGFDPAEGDILVTAYRMNLQRNDLILNDLILEEADHGRA